MSVLAGAAVVTPGGVIDPGWVEIARDRIVAVGPGRPVSGPARDLGGGWLLPGFIDLHMHGGGGHDMTSSPDELAAAVAFHRLHGTTRTLASLVTAPVDELVRQLGWIAELTRKGAGPHGHLLGAHLEGPFLAAARCGAQNTAHMLAPDAGVLARLLDAGQGTVRVVTIAPELPGALELIRDVAGAGAVAAIEHTDADYAEAAAGFQAGATLATHLFNGMPPLHHRGPGPVGAAMEAGVASELILDGVHLHPSIVRLVAARGIPPVLITDAIAAAGVDDGDYSLGGQPVRVSAGRARLRATGALAGSTLTMDAALRWAVRQVGLPIEVAARAASTTPAAVLGMAGECGSIAPGLAADLVVLDDALRSVQVISAGNLAP